MGKRKTHLTKNLSRKNPTISLLLGVNQKEDFLRKKENHSISRHSVSEAIPNQPDESHLVKRGLISLQESLKSGKRAKANRLAKNPLGRSLTDLGKKVHLRRSLDQKEPRVARPIRSDLKDLHEEILERINFQKDLNLGVISLSRRIFQAKNSILRPGKD